MQSDPDARRQVLVVAGPGRSGTSLFTGLTARLGLHVPKPEVKSNRSNPTGFSEPRWAVDFHNDLLRKADVVVDDGRPEAWELTDRVGRLPGPRAQLARWLEEQFEVSPRVVIKDPRLAWFFDLYQDMAQEAGAELSVVTMLRDPAEVLQSRELAYGTRTTNSTRAVGWVNMMLGIERRTRGLPRATVAYADLLAAWQAAVESADESLRLGLVSGATEAQLADADGLVDPSLRRSLVDWDELGLHPAVRDLTARTYEAHRGLVGLPADQQDAVRKQLDALSEEFRATYEEAAEIARHRTGATVRAERRKAVRRTRQEHAAKTSQPETPPSRAAKLRGRVSKLLRRT